MTSSFLAFVGSLKYNLPNLKASQLTLFEHFQEKYISLGYLGLFVHLILINNPSHRRHIRCGKGHSGP